MEDDCEGVVNWFFKKHSEGDKGTGFSEYFRRNSCILLYSEEEEARVFHKKQSRRKLMLKQKVILLFRIVYLASIPPFPRICRLDGAREVLCLLAPMTSATGILENSFLNHLNLFMNIGPA